MSLPSAIQILSHVEIYSRGNILSLHYEGTRDAMYKYPGAIFGISAERARRAIESGAAISYPNSLNIPRQF